MKKQQAVLPRFIGFVILLMLFGCSVWGVSAAGQTAPEAVKIAVGKVTTKSAVISWQGSKKVDGYLVYLYNNATRSYDRVAVTKKTNYQFRDLLGGERYIFGVRPFVRQDKKLLKGKLQKAKCYTPLAAVKKIKQTSADLNSHRLEWNAVPGADTYEIRYYKDTTRSYESIGSTAKPNCTVSRLKPTRTYRYKIYAVSTAANGKVIRAAASPVFSAYTKPGNVERFTADAVTSTGYRLEWSAVDGAAGYRIWKYDDELRKFVVLANVEKQTRMEIRDLAPCSTAFYKICAYATLAGAQRFGNKTAKLSLTTKPQSVEPFLMPNQEDASNVRIGWKQGVCDGYLIYTSVQEDGPYALIGQIDDPSVCEYTVSRSQDATKLYVRIKTYITVDQNKIRSAYSSALEIESTR